MSAQKAQTLRLPAWMYVALEQEAELNKRSVNAQIEYLVEPALKELGYTEAVREEPADYETVEAVVLELVKQEPGKAQRLISALVEALAGAAKTRCFLVA